MKRIIILLLILIPLIIVTYFFSLKQNGLEYNSSYSSKDYIRIQHKYGKSFHQIFGPSRFYNGIEIELKNEALIYSVTDGIVINVCDTCTRGFGKRVLIKHNDSLEINYYHLSSVKVKEGNVVQKGQEIGDSGSTGLTSINGLVLQQKSMANL